MQRLNFRMEQTLFDKLEEDAKKGNVPVSTLIVDWLSRHYGLIPESTFTVTELTAKVFKEVEEYISTRKSGDEFDLLTASISFRDIGMIYAGKPSTVRAKIGRIFVKKIGKPGMFKNIAAQVNSRGNLKKSKNKSAIYVIL